MVVPSFLGPSEGAEDGEHITCLTYPPSIPGCSPPNFYLRSIYLYLFLHLIPFQFCLPAILHRSDQTSL